MNKLVLTRICCVSILSMSAMSFPALSATIDNVVSTELSGAKKIRASQKRIDAIYEKTDDARNEAQTNAKVVKGLISYNSRLNQTVVAQKKAMTELRESIQNADDIERQILPLIIRMLDSIDNFIAKDVPFLKKQRVESIEDIRGYMINTKVPVSERLRLVIDTYGREIRYGKSISAYSDSIVFEGKSLEVDMLRVGRVGLYFQTKDMSVSGVWDKSASDWIPLDGKYSEPVRRAIRIAQQKISPDLLRDLPFVTDKVKQ